MNCIWLSHFWLFWPIAHQVFLLLVFSLTRFISDKSRKKWHSHLWLFCPICSAHQVFWHMVFSFTITVKTWKGYQLFIRYHLHSCIFPSILLYTDQEVCKILYNTFFVAVKKTGYFAAGSQWIQQSSSTSRMESAPVQNMLCCVWSTTVITDVCCDFLNEL